MSEPEQDSPNSPTGTTGTTGKRWINFDAVLPQTVDVTRGGRTLHLRDDVRFDDAIRVTSLIEMQQTLRDTREMSAAEIQRWYGEMRALARELVTRFIQHSYPEMTEAEVDDWLDFKEQVQLAQIFFHLRLSGSSTPERAPTPDSSASTATTRAATATTKKPAVVGRSATASRQPGSRAATSRRK